MIFLIILQRICTRLIYPIHQQKSKSLIIKYFFYFIITGRRTIFIAEHILLIAILHHIQFAASKYCTEMFRLTMITNSLFWSGSLIDAICVPTNFLSSFVYECICVSRGCGCCCCPWYMCYFASNTPIY